jgi:retron-type reverse transcriptase
MLECGIVTAGLGEEQVTVKTIRGCPQRRVLSPLLWSLVIDKLLNDLDRQGLEETMILFFQKECKVPKTT